MTEESRVDPGPTTQAGPSDRVDELMVPSTPDELSAWLRSLPRDARLQVQGLGTNCLVEAGDRRVVSTVGLDKLVHRVDDFSVSVGAGVPWDRLQTQLRAAGQRIAADVPGSGTVGSMVATGARGGLIHRFGPIRDQIIGMTVVLADGTVAHSGGTVIKNVAGYDLAKLFTNSRGRFGVIAEVVFRTRPLPGSQRTVVFSVTSDRVQEVVVALRAGRVQLSAIDFANDSLSCLIEGDESVIAQRVARLAASVSGLEVMTLDQEESQAHWRTLIDGQRPVVSGATLGISARSTRLLTLLDELRDDFGSHYLGSVAHSTAGVAEVSVAGVGLGELCERIKARVRSFGAGMELRARSYHGVGEGLSSEEWFVDPSPVAAGALHTPETRGPRELEDVRQMGAGDLISRIALALDPLGRFR